MPIHVKAHRRGKSVVKAYDRTLPKKIKKAWRRVNIAHELSIANYFADKSGNKTIADRLLRKTMSAQKAAQKIKKIAKKNNVILKIK